jgi:putative chitinase
MAIQDPLHDWAVGFRNLLRDNKDFHVPAEWTDRLNLLLAGDEPAVIVPVKPSIAAKVDRNKFFPFVRQSVFGGRLKQSQVDGMNAILDAWDKSTFTDPRWLGYMMGTAYHETAATMQPIKEYGSYDYFENMYGPNGRRPEVARSMGNVNPGDGAKFCGRGYVQNTWANNYKRGGKLVGVDLYNNPDLAMRPDIAAKLMFAGMTDREMIFEDFSDDQNFSFTGKSLEDYFNDTTEDWYNARRIINGTQAAALIAETAENFFAALT